jgi:hypothetical protein
LYPPVKLAAVDAVSITEGIARSFFLGKASTTCCAVHAEVGESVSLKCRDLTAMMQRHHEHEKHAEGSCCGGGHPA